MSRICCVGCQSVHRGREHSFVFFVASRPRSSHCRTCLHRTCSRLKKLRTLVTKMNPPTCLRQSSATKSNLGNSQRTHIAFLSREKTRQRIFLGGSLHSR